MKYDREEAYLHEKLTGGLHPAGVDLWPAVAEHLPDAPPARHPRWKLAICLAAPLLIAAGVLAGTAEFTNLRENPRPSFAPEANTGYAITYERQYLRWMRICWREWWQTIMGRCQTMAGCR